MISFTSAQVEKEVVRKVMKTRKNCVRRQNMLKSISWREEDEDFSYDRIYLLDISLFNNISPDFENKSYCIFLHPNSNNQLTLEAG